MSLFLAIFKLLQHNVALFSVVHSEVHQIEKLNIHFSGILFVCNDENNVSTIC